MNIYKRVFSLQASYIVIFLSLFLWTFFAYNTMIELIDTQKVYSKLINISGMQRMYSQKTQLLVKNIVENSTDDSYKVTLKTLIKQMYDNHQFLVQHITSQDIRDFYYVSPNEINKSVEEYFGLINRFLDNNEANLVIEIESKSNALLPKLNSVVFALEDESDKKIEQLKQREFFILLGTILTLILDAFIVAIPALRIVRNSKQKLKTMNENLTFMVEEKTKMLQDEKDLFVTYLNNINALIVVLDKFGKIIMINKNGCNLLGYKLEDILGKNWFDINTKHQIFKQQFEMTLENLKEDEIFFEEELLTQNNEPKLMKWSTTKLLLNNETVGILCSAIDITKERKQEIIINQQARNAALGEMIANIAHQWRQPLSIISTTATGLKLQKEYGALNDEDFYTGCDHINDQAQYLSKTIDDFRAFTKGEISLSEFDMNDNINQFLSLVKAAVDNYYIHVVLSLKEHPKLKSYPEQLKQCFINIFNNAKDELKKMPESQRYFFIETNFTQNQVKIVFTDSAGGIAEEIMPKIFDPYFTTKHNSNGTGLGLSMTYDIITNGLNGTISAQNVEYDYDNKHLKGAQFTIILPLQ